MGYLVAVLLVALGTCAAFFSFVGSLGEALCDSGDCSGPSSTPELLLVLALVAFSMAVVAGTLTWRKETRAAEAATAGTLGQAIFAICSIASLGIVLGAVVLLILDP